jgi:hypothetical protein
MASKILRWDIKDIKRGKLSDLANARIMYIRDEQQT